MLGHGTSVLLAAILVGSFLVSSCAAESAAAAGSSARYNVQLSGTKELDSLSSVAAGAWSVVTSGLLAAVLVTAALYLVGAGGLLHSSRASRRVTSDLHGGYYGGWHGAGHQDRWGRRQEQPGPDSLDTLLALLSVDSIQEVVTSVKHGLLGGLSSVKDSSLQRVDEAQSLLSNTITGGIEAIGGGSKLEDCVLQAICYLTPDEETEAGESRKNKDKQTRREEKRREKKNKKKNKKNKKKETEKKDTFFDDYEDDYDEYEEDTESVTEVGEGEGEDEVTSDDCHVFQCDTVRYGYMVYTLVDKLQNLRSKIASSVDDY